MWTRKLVKQRGKQALRLNYWKAVLVAIVFGLVFNSAAGGAAVGAAGGASGAVAGTTMGGNAASTQTITQPEFPFEENGSIPNPSPAEIQQALEQAMQQDEGVRQAVMMIGGIFLVLLIFLALIAILFDVFVKSPLEVGIRRFYLRNLAEKAELKELAHGYDNRYLNVVKILFFRDLFLFLWTLLFIIPGIIKAYQYRMIPYILADDPGISRKEAFARTKKMMKGNKWKTFVLDLSFIGWRILSCFTFGLLNLFYVDPYYHGTCAAQYVALLQRIRPAGAPAQEGFSGAAPEVMIPSDDVPAIASPDVPETPTLPE